MPDDLAEEKYRVLEVCGCDVVKVKPLAYMDKGNFVRLAGIKAKEEGGFFADQFDNLDNYKGHYADTGPEIWQQMDGNIDIYVNASGTGATTAGVSKFLKEQDDSILTILGDPQGSSFYAKVVHDTLFTMEDKEGHKERHPFRTIVEGVGQNRLTKNFMCGKIDDAFQVTDQECLHMAYFLIDNEGLFLGTSTALNLVTCVKAARKYTNFLKQKKSKGRIVICTQGCDQGLVYLSKFYSQKYLSSKGIQFQK